VIVHDQAGIRGHLAETEATQGTFGWTSYYLFIFFFWGWGGGFGQFPIKFLHSKKCWEPRHSYPGPIFYVKKNYCASYYAPKKIIENLKVRKKFHPGPENCPTLHPFKNMVRP